MIGQSIIVNVKINVVRLPISRYDKVIAITLTLMLRKNINIGFKKNNKTFQMIRKQSRQLDLGGRGNTIPERRAAIEVRHIFEAIWGRRGFGIFVRSKYGAKKGESISL